MKRVFLMMITAFLSLSAFAGTHHDVRWLTCRSTEGQVNFILFRQVPWDKNDPVSYLEIYSRSNDPFYKGPNGKSTTQMIIPLNTQQLNTKTKYSFKTIMQEAQLGNTSKNTPVQIDIKRQAGGLNYAVDLKTASKVFKLNCLLSTESGGRDQSYVKKDINDQGGYVD